MAIVVNTNVQSIQVQNNLNRVTDAMNTAMERMTTGSKITHASDDAAGLVISKGIEVQTRGTTVAKSNAQSGTNLLQTAGYSPWRRLSSSHRSGGKPSRRI